jgi:hypothetical protein
LTEVLHDVILVREPLVDLFLTTAGDLSETLDTLKFKSFGGSDLFFYIGVEL